MRRMYEAIESCYPTLWYASMRERLHAIRRHMESVPGLKAPERLYQRIHDAVAPTTSLDENHVNTIYEAALKDLLERDTSED